jgi:hypothetical protein
MKSTSVPLFLGRSHCGLLQIPFRLDDGLLPLVGPGRAELREQLVFAHPHPPALSHPVGQKAEHAERGRAQDVERGAQAIDRLEQLVGPAARDPFPLVNGLAANREEVPGRARAADAVGLGLGVDLTPESRVDLHADEAEPTRFGAASAG